LGLGRIGLRPIKHFSKMEIRGDITGIIMAGGQNLRMGRNKAFIIWRGKRLLDWVYDAIRPLCTKIIISANDENSSYPEALVVPDRYQRIGPIAGIEAGLTHSNTEMNIIVSCDTPMLSTAFFRYMIKQHQKFDISIPIHDGVNEPLIGIYNRSVLPRFQDAISRGLYKPPPIIKSCNFQEVPINQEMNFYQPDLFLNLNKPEDLKNISNK